MYFIYPNMTKTKMYISGKIWDILPFFGTKSLKLSVHFARAAPWFGLVTFKCLLSRHRGSLLDSVTSGAGTFQILLIPTLTNQVPI